MINLLIVFMVFIAALGIGLLGMGLFKLLPSSIRKRIEQFHDEN